MTTYEQSSRLNCRESLSACNKGFVVLRVGLKHNLFCNSDNVKNKFIVFLETSGRNLNFKSELRLALDFG